MPLLFAVVLMAVIAQRLAELWLAARNAKLIRRMGGFETAEETYPPIVALHIAFFCCLTAEYAALRPAPGILFPAGAALYAILQGARYWCIRSLGPFWNTRVFVVPGMEPVRRGPYRFMKHPNYAVVTLELLVLPLMFGCFVTAALFPFLNVFVLKRRIAAEEAALRKAVSASNEKSLRDQPAGEGA